MCQTTLGALCNMGSQSNLKKCVREYNYHFLKKTNKEGLKGIRSVSHIISILSGSVELIAHTFTPKSVCCSQGRKRIKLNSMYHILSKWLHVGRNYQFKYT